MNDQTFKQLIEEHLPLVRHVMFQVSVRFPRHVDREELLRAGVLGLVQAARRYDLDKGVPFQRFAAQRIRGAILDGVRSGDWAPRSLRRSARDLEVTAGQLANELGRAPTTTETADALGMTAQELSELQQQVARSVVLTLDMAVMDGDDQDEISLGDTVADVTDGPQEQLENRELHAYLHDAVGLLPERHRVVIEGYFFGGRTSEDIADELGVSVSRVSQLRSDAFEMLREGITAQYAESGDGPVSIDPAARARGSRVARRKAAYAASIAAQRSFRTRIESPSSAAPVPVAG